MKMLGVALLQFIWKSIEIIHKVPMTGPPIIGNQAQPLLGHQWPRHGDCMLVWTGLYWAVDLVTSAPAVHPGQISPVHDAVTGLTKSYTN